jgi:two-component system, NtrC family, response regulator AtoC
MPLLLVIEDEEVLAKNIKRTLERLGHEVAVAGTCREGERLFAELAPDLTLLDLQLPDATGLELLPRLCGRDAHANVIIMTAYASVEDAVAAIKLGARDYLQKPLRMDDLRHAVTRALEERQLKTELSYYRSREAKDAAVESIVGRCAPIEDLRAKLRRLCALPPSAIPPTVLVSGETGTGKGLVARVLHYNGPRAARPFIEINCGAIPEHLVEAELFGHERGAFTDARAARIGLIQAADRGTLFLDELGALPLPIQVKVLKVIEEKTVRLVGGRSERPVDVQIIGATNADLEAMVRDGSFREDLYYRLRVATLAVPPLRERGDDVILLAVRLLEELAARYRAPRKRLSEDAERALRRYGWPGNVRELRNTLDRAVVFGEGEIIDAGALALPDAGRPWAPRLDVEVATTYALELPPGGIRFETLERSLLVQALKQAHGSQSGAARLLGMSRDTLRYRLEKFGIDPAAVGRGA